MSKEEPKLPLRSAESFSVIERSLRVFTVSALGLLAYASADVAHHLLGHGVACLASSGSVRTLSSVVVDCNVKSIEIDLAGPAANLLIGVLMACVALIVSRATLLYLFLKLVATLNLLWFAMQLLYSAATLTDDWAWAIDSVQSAGAVRVVLVLAAAGTYVTVLYVASNSLTRTQWRNVWLSAGCLACVTALFDHHPMATLLEHAVPQSLLNSIGILFLPFKTAISRPRIAVKTSMPMIVAALCVAAAVIAMLGPGVSIDR